MSSISLKKVNLGLYPTPLHFCESLSKDWERKIWLKREDLSGFMGGGNKVRQAEYLIAEALSQGATDIVAAGGAQSNHLRILSGAAAKYHLNCHLALYGKEVSTPTGNLLISKMAGAHLNFSGKNPRTSADDLAKKLCEELKKKGQRPYFIPRGGASVTGILGWIDFVKELKEQTEDLKIDMDRLILPVGSGGTIAGIQQGQITYDANWKVTGFATSKNKTKSLEKVLSLAKELDENKKSLEGIEIFDEFLGGGYGVITPEVVNFSKNFLKKNGILLDPVFSAKAMMGTKALIDSNYFDKNENMVLLITGGETALFSDRYQDELFSS